MDKRCRGLKKADVSDNMQMILRMTRTELGGADQLYRQTTIDALPDNVILETFEFYLDKDDADKIDGRHNYDGWHTIVHVCHRWRCIVFASPRRLDLKLFCTRQRSVNSRTLDIWPALPIFIYTTDIQSKEDVTNVIAVLRHHNRVCKIHFSNWGFQDPLLKEFAAIDEPFPALTTLMLSSLARDVPVLPDSFLGGSAPRLRSLELDGIPYPSIGRLLSSTTNLVRLFLRNIPHSGYIAPETIVPCMSMLPRLRLLELEFRSPRPRAHQASRHPPLTHVVFPTLTYLRFSGDVEYLEDILSQIETPMLNHSELYFVNQLVFDTPLLGQFIRRTETFMKIHMARVEISSGNVEVTLWGREEMADDDMETRSLSISYRRLDWQLSALPQVLNHSCLPF